MAEQLDMLVIDGGDAGGERAGQAHRIVAAADTGLEHREVATGLLKMEAGEREQRLLVEAGIDVERDKVKIGPVPGAFLGENKNFGVAAANALQAGMIDGFWANGMGAEVAVRSGAGTSSHTVSPSRLARSWGTTTSTPSGTGAPVKMRTAPEVPTGPPAYRLPATMNSEPNAVTSRNHCDGTMLAATPPAMQRSRNPDATMHSSNTGWCLSPKQ